MNIVTYKLLPLVFKDAVFWNGLGNLPALGFKKYLKPKWIESIAYV